MNPFTYARAVDAGDAVARAAVARTMLLGGGTNLVDLMREGIVTPDHLVDVGALATAITPLPDGGLRIGGGATNAAIAGDPDVRARYPMLSQAILEGASPQVRNMATAAGNLLQRTRCPYFYDGALRCNKRHPGSGCDAIGGHNAHHALFGWSPQCVATHPSDMCVALAALGATIRTRGPAGAHAIDFADFHRLPGDAPDIDTALPHGHLVEAIDLSPPCAGAAGAYRKVRERASYAFAVVSVAAVVAVSDGVVRDARVALGGVAARPWRSARMEAALVGRAPDVALFEAAADLLLEDARPLAHNGYKVGLVRRVLVQTLLALSSPTGSAP